LSFALLTSACAGSSGSSTSSDGTATSDGSPSADTSVICGARLPGGESVDLEFEGATISALRPEGQSALCLELDGMGAGDTEGGDARMVDGRGLWLSPAFIDSHVHLIYFPAAD